MRGLLLAGLVLMASDSRAREPGVAVARAWTTESISYRGPATVPGSTGSDATMRASAGRTLLIVEVVLNGDRATLSVPDVEIVDSRQARYAAVGSAGTTIDNFQPFAGFVSGWVGTFGPKGPMGPLVKIGRDQPGDPVRVELAGAGANVFLIYSIPSDAGPLTIALGGEAAVPLELTKQPGRDRAPGVRQHSTAAERVDTDWRAA